MNETSSVYSRFLRKLNHEDDAGTPTPPKSPEPAEASPPDPTASNPDVHPPQNPVAPVARKKIEPIGTKRLIISATSKGGVGKSYVSVNLAEWFKSQTIPFTAFDPDWCNSSFTRFYPEAEFIDVSETVRLDEVIRAFDRTDVVIVDGVGSLQLKFLDWLEETRIFDMRAQLDLDVTLIVIIEEDKETVFQAGQAAKRIGNRANWLVVRNLKTSPVTEIYDNSNARRDLLELDAFEITIDRLPWNLNSVLQKTSKSIGALSEDESIFFLERQRLRSYQQRLFEEFASAKQVLLPGSILGKSANVKAVEAPVLKGARPRIPPAEV